MYEKLLKLQVSAKIKKDQFLHEERGEVNMIAIIMIIAVVIVLAVVFKDQLKKLIEELFGKIQGKADSAMSQMDPSSVTPK
ncbi:MAG: Flp1 family type IVb pilin [Clostridiales bacterium]|nr:Flp1 family type IVb pilin [Clostridiales bacterium]